MSQNEMSRVRHVTQLIIDQAAPIRARLHLEPISAPRWSDFLEFIDVGLISNGRRFPEDASSPFCAQVFLCAYDFAAAFGSEEGFGGEFDLPYDNVVFEFSIGGDGGEAKRVCAWFYYEPGSRDLGCLLNTYSRHEGWKRLGPLFIEDAGGWAFASNADEDPVVLTMAWAVFGLVLEQVAAAMLVLASGIAETDVIQPSPKLQRARERRRKPSLPAYSVVTLPRQPSSGSTSTVGTERHIRAHWRRRHVHRFWTAGGLAKKVIGPFRVGDESLGSVGQLYRLYMPQGQNK